MRDFAAGHLNDDKAAEISTKRDHFWFHNQIECLHESAYADGRPRAEGAGRRSELPR
jgi:hypothetical protein